MENTYLQSSIAKRIMDILGIFSKDMPDIRNDFYRVRDNTWAGKLNIDNEALIFMYYEDNSNNRYMITRFVSKNEKGYWFNIVSMDDNEDPDLNKIFVSLEIDKKIKFREISYIEIANIFKGFEIIRQYMPHWLAYDPSKEDYDMLDTFINSTKVEDA